MMYSLQALCECACACVHMCVCVLESICHLWPVYIKVNNCNGFYSCFLVVLVLGKLAGPDFLLWFFAYFKIRMDQ